MELASFLLEIPNCAYNITRSRVLVADRLIFDDNEKATLPISMPFFADRCGKVKYIGITSVHVDIGS